MGPHIKGLLINLFSTFWPSLLRLPGFLNEFITPIVRATRGKVSHSFYTLPEFEAWSRQQDKGWKVKYFKGLGTSTAKDAKEYFSDLDKHQIDFRYDGPDDDAAIDKAFNKKKADLRKDWLGEMQPGTFLDQANLATLGYQEFIDKELILFSQASNVRGIPSLVDGLKPGQRKILFAAFKRNLVDEIKVAQLAGYVSEHAAYHHGEMSLTGTIVNMAQNFVGSNNINLLVPSGQFGTRMQGGKDSASPRYIFTNLSPLTRYLFPAVDDPLFPPLVDDGTEVEPAWYCPVLPMVLVNGAAGIGTGWSTSVPNFNPRVLAENVLCLLDDKPLTPLIPWYKNFQGDTTTGLQNRIVFEGTIAKVDAVTFVVSELPVTRWTNDYKAFLETLVDKGVLRDFQEHSTPVKACFVLVLASEQRAREAEAEGLHQVFCLTESVALTNMVLFTEHGSLQRFGSAEEILRAYFVVRQAKYGERKTFQEAMLVQECERLKEKIRFLVFVINNTVRISGVPKQEIEEQLVNHQFSPDKGGFDYLLGMPLWSITAEKVTKLRQDYSAKQQQLSLLRTTSPSDMWRADLERLLAKMDEVEKREAVESAADAAKFAHKQKMQPAPVGVKVESHRTCKLFQVPCKKRVKVESHSTCKTLQVQCKKQGKAEGVKRQRTTTSAHKSGKKVKCEQLER